MMFKKLLIWLLAYFLTFAPMVQAASYYVDSSYSGTESGTFTQPWNSLSDVTGLTTSDKLYLKCGSIFDQQRITIAWGGTALDNGLLGAYYDGGGAPVVGVNVDGKPLIKGTIDYDVEANNYPAIGSLLGLVTVNGAYMTVQDVATEDSGQFGISAAASGDYATIQRCDVNKSIRTGIYYPQAATGGTTHRNRVRDSALVTQANWPWTTWTAAIRIGPNSTTTYNYIEGSHGEAYNAYGSDSVVIKYNVSVSANSVHYYFDGTSNAEAAFNLALETTNKDYSRFPANTFNSRGYEVNFETYNGRGTNAENMKFHHNIGIGMNSGVKMVRTHPTRTWDYLYIYNNLLIDNWQGIYVIDNQEDITDFNVWIKNNVIVTLHGSANPGSINGSINPLTWDIDSNTWYPTNPAADLAGTNTSNADPGLPFNGGGIYHENITAITDLTNADLVPTSLEAGVDLGDDYDEVLDPNNTNFIKTNPPNEAIDLALIDHDSLDVGWNRGPWAPGSAEPPPDPNFVEVIRSLFGPEVFRTQSGAGQP